MPTDLTSFTPGVEIWESTAQRQTRELAERRNEHLIATRDDIARVEREYFASLGDVDYHDPAFESSDSDSDSDDYESNNASDSTSSDYSSFEQDPVEDMTRAVTTANTLANSSNGVNALVAFLHRRLAGQMRNWENDRASSSAQDSDVEADDIDDIAFNHYSFLLQCLERMLERVQQGQALEPSNSNSLRYDRTRPRLHRSFFNYRNYIMTYYPGRRGLVCWAARLGVPRDLIAAQRSMTSLRALIAEFCRINPERVDQYNRRVRQRIHGYDDDDDEMYFRPPVQMYGSDHRRHPRMRVSRL